jgi:hypothetical protein
VQSLVESITVPPYSTQDVSLAAAMGQFPTALPFAAVRIQYSGAPGSLQAEVPSVESAGNLVVDSIVQNEGNGWAGSGANPWHLDQDTESILFLTNASDQPAHIGFQVTASGSAPYFLTKLKLNPHETRAIDFRKLRDAQKPDFHKNLIPSGATDGSVNWVRGDNLPVMGRLMQIHRKAGMASNYDCGQCACPYNYTPPLNEMSPTSCGVAVGSELPAEFEAGYEDCNLMGYWYDYTDSASWTSSSPSIAEIMGYGLIKGVSTGTAQVQASYSGEDYTFQGSYCNPTPPVFGSASVPCSVGQPDHVSVVLDQEGYPASCPATGVYVRQMQMQVVDIGGNAIAVDAHIQESFSPITNTCGNGQPEPSPCALTGSPFGTGQFLDTMSVSQNFCGSGISQSSGCGFSQTSTWKQCQPSGSNTLWTSPRVTHSNGVEVNGSWTQYSAGTQFH